MSDVKTLLLFGFVRRFYKFLIPHDVICIINQWTVSLDEWDEDNTNANIEIDKYKHRIVRYKKTNWSIYACHAFGTDIVEKGDIVYWDLKLNSSSTNIAMKIGIIDADEVALGLHDFTDYICFGYGISTIDNGLYHRGRKAGFPYLHGFKWTQGCIIRVELDMNQISNAKISNNGTLKYFVKKQRGQKQGVMDMKKNLECTAFWNVDTSRKYKLCVALIGDLNQAELIHVSSLDKII